MVVVVVVVMGGWVGKRIHLRWRGGAGGVRAAGWLVCLWLGMLAGVVMLLLLAVWLCGTSPYSTAAPHTPTCEHPPPTTHTHTSNRIPMRVHAHTPIDAADGEGVGVATALVVVAAIATGLLPGGRGSH